ncbi:TIGR01777 family protein [Bacillus mangrovi]|uniref:TIGR01777 family protein n=1 Tax=Metabacillus mangrovi TaxID=1491830 RepID=A0A7X2S7V9_9BACI|nr:TIGR01777 family oxidoreductase [Metabacillus mangrovi]MTH54982.1 TIGR01777 family protein [Metabacillus mangrovi]
MKRKIVLAGGTGFIGEYLKKQFLKEGYEIAVISRSSSEFSWDRPETVTAALDGAELLINLAGKSVNCRYNAKNKEEIFTSRTETTELLGNAILQCKNPPPLWINSSTATIYRHAEDRPMTEETGEIGTGFSVEVAKAWEKSFFDFRLPATRQAALRIAIVLGPGGGVMTPYKNLAKFGLGGVQGSGNQMFSWIHVEDVYRIIRYIQANEQLSGVYNCSAPNPVTNREFMTAVREAMGVKFGLPSPKWMLELGAVFIKTETELVLKSRWVVPERLEREGYKFTYPEIDSALREII